MSYRDCIKSFRAATDGNIQAVDEQGTLDEYIDKYTNGSLNEKTIRAASQRIDELDSYLKSIVIPAIKAKAPEFEYDFSVANEQELAANESTESVAKDAAKEKISEEVERVQPSSTVAYFADVSKRLRDGNVTLDEYKSAFELFSSSKEVISGELAKKTKAELLGMMDKMAAYRAKNEKKEDVIDSVYHDMLEDYVLGNSFSFSMGKNAYENGIRNVVNKQTDESLKEFADSIKLRREESRQKKEAAAVGMENPQALGDYVNLLKSYMRDGMSFQDARMKLTPVQRAEFDVLTGSETRNERKAKADQQKTEVRVAAQTTGAQIVEGVHTKHGYELWSVQLADKVDGDSYKTLLSTAKRMGGNYVNTMQARMWKTVWGFQFRDEDKAKAFMQLAAGDTTAAQEAVQERRDAFADDRSQSAVERLNEMADKLDERADSALNDDRKTNTARRARFAASAESSANSSKAMAQTMRNIASAIESGKANFLDRVRQKTQVEMLHGIVNTAHYDELRNKYPQYSDYEKHIGEAPTTETADYVKFPDYTLYRSDMARLGRELLEAEGTKRLGQAIMKVADDTSDAYSKFAKENLNKVNQFRKQDGKLAAFSTKRDAENSIRGSGLSGKAIVLTVKRNEHLIVLSPSEAINQRLWDGDSDKRITLNKEAGAEIVEKIGKTARRGSKISMPWQFENAYEKLKRLSGMGIEKPAELRAAVREFINLKETPAKESKIKKMERSMIGRAKDGLDFFPTPESAADQMIEAADIKEGMSVLEPSAGMGHIADRIRDAGVEPDVIEMSGDRREILVAKGFNVVGSDFMASENGQYDRIIMNPPFSNRRDVEHVRHAYDLLNPGGRLVAIMGEGSFFGRDKKAVEFRDWLESIGGTSEKLDEGTFLDPSLPINTGVNARMVVIEKPSTDDIKYSRRSTIGGNQGNSVIGQADLDRAINDFVQEFANPGGVEFVARESIVDAFGVENAARLRKQGVRTVKGAFYSKAGRVLLIRKGLVDYRDALSTIRHELLGHYGLNLFTPTEKKDILEQIIASKEAVGISKTWKQIEKDYSDKSELEQAEEVFAKLAESKQFMLSKAWNSIIHFVKKLFVKMGFIPDTYTKKELYDLIETIGEGIRRGDSTQTNPEADDLQFSKKNLPDSIEVSGEFDINNPDIRFSRSATQNQTYTSKNGKRVTRAQIEALASKNNVTADEVIQRLGLVPDNANQQTAGQSSPANSTGRKKIIGDSGREHTEEQLHMFDNIGRSKDTNVVLASLKKWANQNWWQGLFDQFDPIKKISNYAYTLARLSKGSAGAFEALMHHGKLSIKDGAYDADNTGGVLEKVFFPIGKETTDFLYWIAGNRAEKLMAEDKEHLFTDADIVAAKSLADGETDFDYTKIDGSVTRNRSEIYTDTLVKFNEFNKNVLDMAEQSHLIDGESRQHWESEFYVPFYRVNEDDGIRSMNIKQGTVRQQAFKKLKGGTDGMNDLLSNTLTNWAHLIDASVKNRSAEATLEAAEKIGAAHPAAYGEKKTVWFMGMVTKAIPKGEVYTECGVEKISDGTHATTVHGKREYVVDDPALITALEGLDYSGMKGPLMDALSATKKWLTIGVTASPFFKVRNLIRDSMQSVAVSGLSYNIPKNIVTGIKLTDHNNQEYASALASGALIRFGTMLEGNESSRVRRLIKNGASDEHILDNENKLRAFYDRWLEPALTAYNELGNRGEELNRMALYDQLIKQGTDHATAALMARDLMDFSMQGSFTTVRLLSQVVPFMNARLQGMYKLGRASKTNRSKMITVTAAVSMLSLALLAAYKDDDDWKEREDWDRDNYWWFKVGGIAYRIPKPFEIGAIATLAERTAELMLDDEMTVERFASVIGTLAGNQLAMNPTPQLVKPIIDLYANKDGFTGRPIETMGMDKLESEYRYTSRTSMVARGASKAAGGALSPVQIDHLINGYFSWLGGFIVGGTDMAIRAMSDEPTRPALDPFKFLSGGMVAQKDNSSSRYVSRVYEQAEELEQAYGTYRDMLKRGDKSGAAEFKQDNIGKLRKFHDVEKVKKLLSGVSKRIRSIEAGGLSPAEKRVQIDALRERQNKLAKRLN